MARRRKKARNPKTPWLKYALFAAGGYFVYRILKDKGILGGNGDDDYAPYTPGPVVKKVDEMLSKVPVRILQSAPGEVVALQRKKKEYDLTYEKYKEAPKLTAQAQAAFDAAQRQMKLAKAKATHLRNEANTRGINPVTARAKNIEARKKEIEVTGIQSQLPALQQEVRTKQNSEKLPAKELRKLERELSEAAKVQRVNDWIEAASLATKRGVAAE